MVADNTGAEEGREVVVDEFGRFADPVSDLARGHRAAGVEVFDDERACRTTDGVPLRGGPDDGGNQCIALLSHVLSVSRCGGRGVRAGRWGCLGVCDPQEAEQDYTQFCETY